MIWIISRIIKYYKLIVHCEHVSASFIAREYICKRNARKIGIKNYDRLLYYSDDQFVIGENSHIQGHANIWCHDNEDTGPCKEGGRGVFCVGSNVYIGHGFHADCYNKVIIKDECLLADDILIMTSMHGMDPELRESYVKQPITTREVVVEEGCWIGSRVTLLPGVTIGKKSIIGTNSVVTKCIPSYSIAAGVPAKVIKRFDFSVHQWTEP